jgi:hypothetical protein
MARVLCAWQIGLAAFPAREKRARGSELERALRVIATTLAPERYNALLGASQAPDLAQNIGLSATERRDLFAASIAQLYIDQVNPRAGFSRSGPAVRFILSVLHHAGIGTTEAAIELSLRSFRENQPR